MDEEALRNIAADGMAQGFLTEYLLLQFWQRLPLPMRLAQAKGVLDASIRTDHYAGLTKGNDAASELLSDVIVRMHGCVDQYVGRALLRCEEADEALGRGEEPLPI